VSSTRSVGMNLARRFNRGPRAGSPRGVAAPGSDHGHARRVATIESGPQFQASLRNAGYLEHSFPALKDRAKFIPTLRVKSTCSEFVVTLRQTVPEVYRTFARARPAKAGRE
jgi:hypothetical protein